MKTFTLLSADGTAYQAENKGVLGGNSKARIYGRLDCSSALRVLTRGYAKHRVFFASENDAIAAGYRPCGNCMKQEYRKWLSEGGDKN
jgi:methylphosphotriester-DNA--protein-cysteine methyltransferase